MKEEFIEIIGARENNLKNIDVKIPRNSFTVITGLSGSGKTSLALDTLYAEGIRRYIECLSTYARQFFDRVDKPDFDSIKGLPTAIAIESRNNTRNSRSTVGTTTEIYDYLRLLFAKVGEIFCHNCGNKIIEHSPQSITEELISYHNQKRAYITFTLTKEETSPQKLTTQGYSRIYKDGKLLQLEETQSLPEHFQVVVDRIIIEESASSRLNEALETAFREKDEIHIFLPDQNKSLRYTRRLECPRCKIRVKRPTPNLFSFNNPYGACKYCNGFGNVLDIDPKLVVPNPQKSLEEGAIEPFTKPSYRFKQKALLEFAKKHSIDVKKPYSDLSEKEKQLIIEGDEDFNGVKGFFRRLEEKKYKMHIRVMLSKYRSPSLCPKCKGSRLKEEALYVKIGNKNIHELCSMPVSKLADFFSTLKLSSYQQKISKDILKEILSRTQFLLDVGLHYLTLSRLTKSLSGGEAQRINLACQLGARLTETLYILDEPSIGLHPRDIDRLISIILELKKRKNTVVVVEHDPELIKASDFIIELGPEAGEKGGNLVFQGTFSEFIESEVDSYTKHHLTNKKSIPVPKTRRKGNGKTLKIIGATQNNLKNIDVSIPLETITCVTGVSGSGKSSLVKEVLYNNLARLKRNDIENPGKVKSIEGSENIKDVILLDQSPVGRSSRSNPVTYIKVYDEIRKVISSTLRAKIKGLKPSYFSFNVSGGRCEECKGEGKQSIEMHFIADVITTCPECNGKRFKKDILEYRYKGKNIDDILNMTVDEAIIFFEENSQITKKLKILKDVGLGYIRLGQPAITLSGGEAQRLKIARELIRKDGRDILYLLDEPTVGLHAEDIKKLITVINKLVDNKNTVVVIEHNLDFIKIADYIIDLGPEGGDNGGYVIAQGTPEEIASCDVSHTGNYLKQLLY